MYYRHTDTNNPMSDWGHAMFSLVEANTFCTKNCHWQFDGSNAVSIESLRGTITEAWNKSIDEGFEALGLSFEDYELAYMMDLNAEQVNELLNPEDIVDGARGWDAWELVGWFWEAVAEPMDLAAVTTQDGAIVFDADLIKAYEYDAYA